MDESNCVLYNRACIYMYIANGSPQDNACSSVGVYVIDQCLVSVIRDCISRQDNTCSSVGVYVIEQVSVNYVSTDSRYSTHVVVYMYVHLYWDPTSKLFSICCAMHVGQT